ncbi:MAG: hypothetical protein HOB63_09330 [Opitutae bacterium]|mgnify:FL=1|nr:hypothetical protein [Opitutae bacterium]
MKKSLLLLFCVLSACLLPSPFVSADGSKKKPELVPEKQVEPKKKYSFIGKLLEKEKLEPEKKDEDKKEEDKKGKKGKKGKRSYLLKFEVKEVMDGEDALKPGLIVFYTAEPGPMRNPKQVKGAQTEPDEMYRVTSTSKLVKEKDVFWLIDCRLFSAKGKVGDEYKVGKTWNGALPVKSLEFLPEDQRQSPIAYLGDNKVFTAFWESFKPFDKIAPAPQVDFSKNVIVVMKNVRRMEQIIGLKARLDEGTLRVMPKKDFDGFDPRNPLRIVKGHVFVSFFILPRKGITTIASGKEHEFEIKPPGFIYAD